jgi:Mrp family chromosome partitioning ATPase
MEIMARVDLRIQYPAEPPTRPTPRGLGVKLIVSTVMGLLLGALLAGLAEALDRRVRCDTDATEALGLPVLGRIPWLRKARRAEAVLTDPAYQEAVRRLRAALMLNLGGAGGKAVLIAGATNCEGRSVLAAALGESIAAAGRRVVLVDAAAESPTLHSYLGVEAQAGWWDAAAGRGNAASLVQATGKPNLDLLPAGSEPVDPDALASSEVARGIIDSLRATHDLVIVDTSPMEQDSVAALLSGSCDHGLVVVREGHSCRGMVHNLWHHLNHSDGWALGLALVAPRGRTPRR